MTGRWLYGHLKLCVWRTSLVHLTVFDLLGMYVLNMLSPNIALLGVRLIGHYGVYAIGSCPSGCLCMGNVYILQLVGTALDWDMLCASWQARMVLCCLRGLLCDGSDANNAFWMEKRWRKLSRTMVTMSPLCL